MSDLLGSQPYRFELARGPAIAECQRVRHQVYCEELGYEPTRASRRETDAEDDRSDHVLVQDRATGKAVGCSRLIHPAADRLLPCLVHARLDPSDAWLEAAPLCEISRLAVLREVRTATPAHRAGGTVGMQLMLATLAVFLHSRNSYSISLMEPSLADLIGKLGIPIQSSGAAIEFRGLRRLYFCDRTVINRLPRGTLQCTLEHHAQLYPGEPLPRADGLLEAQEAI